MAKKKGGDVRTRGIVTSLSPGDCALLFFGDPEMSLFADIPLDLSPADGVRVGPPAIPVGLTGLWAISRDVADQSRCSLPTASSSSVQGSILSVSWSPITRGTGRPDIRDINVRTLIINYFLISVLNWHMILMLLNTTTKFVGRYYCTSSSRIKNNTDRSSHRWRSKEGEGGVRTSHRGV